MGNAWDLLALVGRLDAVADAGSAARLDALAGRELAAGAGGVAAEAGRAAAADDGLRGAGVLAGEVDGARVVLNVDGVHETEGEGRAHGAANGGDPVEPQIAQIVTRAGDAVDHLEASRDGGVESSAGNTADGESRGDDEERNGKAIVLVVALAGARNVEDDSHETKGEDKLGHHRADNIARVVGAGGGGLELGVHADQKPRNERRADAAGDLGDEVQRSLLQIHQLDHKKGDADGGVVDRATRVAKAEDEGAQHETDTNGREVPDSVGLLEAHRDGDDEEEGTNELGEEVGVVLRKRLVADDARKVDHLFGGCTIWCFIWGEIFCCCFNKR